MFPFQGHSESQTGFSSSSLRTQISLNYKAFNKKRDKILFMSTPGVIGNDCQSAHFAFLITFHCAHNPNEAIMKTLW